MPALAANTYLPLCLALQVDDDAFRNNVARTCRGRIATPLPRRDAPHFPAPPMASIVRLGDDVSFQIIACGDEMMPAAMRSAYSGANSLVRPHQHDCARDGFAAARFAEKVLEEFDHPRFDLN